MDSFQPCNSMCSFVMHSVADGVFAVDRNFIITFFNRAAGEIAGVPPAQARGRLCREVFRASICDESCTLRQCMEEDRRLGDRAMLITRPDGSKVAVSISASPLKDREGAIIGGVETFRDLSAVSAADGLASRTAVEGIFTRDPQLASLIKILPQVAESESTVLLTGESGTGKELFARAIHRLSERRDGPFVAVNCGALPETLMESELFGYKAGAFTDARKDKPGRFALARGGTIFLDEVGDLPLALQVKILRVLQERTFEPLGGVESVRADVRVVASTNRDLDRMVEEGEFRRDLYYRLNVVNLHLAPLRERRGDIPLLVDQLVRHRRLANGKEIRGLSQEAMQILLHYPFPGNVRELENIIEYAFILCPRGFIAAEHLPVHLRPGGGGGHLRLDLGPLRLDEIKRRAAREAVERNQGNRNAACRELGVTKDTLRRLLRVNGADE